LQQFQPVISSPVPDIVFASIFFTQTLLKSVFDQMLVDPLPETRFSIDGYTAGNSPGTKPDSFRQDCDLQVPPLPGAAKSGF
jgi:hypothetical protein